MQKRLKEKQEAYEAQWDGGRGSHHPDYDPSVAGGVKVYLTIRRYVAARQQLNSISPADSALNCLLELPYHPTKTPPQHNTITRTRLHPPPAFCFCPLRRLTGPQRSCTTP